MGNRSGITKRTIGRALAFFVLFELAIQASSAGFPSYLPIARADIIKYVGSAAGRFLGAFTIFLIIDLFALALTKRDFASAARRVRVDLIAWGLGVFALLAPLPFDTVVSPLVLVSALVVAAFVLDAGLVYGLWLVMFVTITPRHLPAMTIGLGNPFYGSGGPELLGLVGAAASLPLLIFIMGARRDARVPRSRLLVVGLLIAGAFGAGYLSVVGVSSRIPEIISSTVQVENIFALSTAATQIERASSQDGISAKNSRLTDVLLRTAALTGQDLHVFRIARSRAAARSVKPELIVAAKLDRDKLRIRTVTSLNKIDTVEREAMFRRLSFPDLWTGQNADEGAKRDSAISIRFLEEDRAPKQAGAARGVLSVDRDRRNPSPYILVATPSNILGPWWRVEPPSAMMIMQETFPYVFYGVLFLSSISLFLVAKRDRLRLELIQAEERARINLEAHDRISNRLSALAIAAETQAGRQAQAQEFFGQLPGTLRRIVSDLKEVTSKTPGNMPISAATLESLLKEVCAKRAAEHGYELEQDIRLADAPTVKASAAEALVLCLEEALGNIAKHAEAQTVDVSATCRETGECRMSVKDDGRGFSTPRDYSVLEAQGHSGLAGIAKRAKELGGAMMIESKPGKGTTLMISWRQR